MATRRDSPGPWAKVSAVDQEALCRELGSHTAGGALLVWFRLCLASSKSRSASVAVPRRALCYDTGLSRDTVRRQIANLERLGFVAVERSRSDDTGDNANTYTILRGPHADIRPESGSPVADGEPPEAKTKPPEAGNSAGRGGVQSATFPRTSVQEHQEEHSRPAGAPKGGPHFTVPTLEDVSGYCRERDNAVDPRAFLDHYTANGWRVGRNPMRDWRAAVRTWERNRSVHSRATPCQRRDDEGRSQNGAPRTAAEATLATGVRVVKAKDLW